MKIKLVSIFCTFVFVLGMFSAVAFAEEEIISEPPPPGEDMVVMPEMEGEVEVVQADETYQPPEPEGVEPPEVSPDGVASLAISGFKVEKAAATAARISFNPVAGATKYLVYRSEAKKGGYTLLRKLTSATAFRDRNLQPGKTYYYKAIAYKKKAKGDFTSVASIRIALGKLQNLTAESIEAGCVRLSWDILEGADKFMVYRAKQEYYNYSNAAKPLKFKLCATVYGQAAEFVDKHAGQGETYYYKVSPYSGDKGSGAVGPVSAKVKLSSRVQAFLKAARAQKGKPYVLGGKGPSVFDCSGLIYYALNNAGYSIPYMTSYGWAASGYKKVASVNAQAGDILCYDGHVGIYAGAGIIIDASTSLNAVVERPLWGTVKFAKRVF